MSQLSFVTNLKPLAELTSECSGLDVALSVLLEPRNTTLSCPCVADPKCHSSSGQVRDVDDHSAPQPATLAGRNAPCRRFCSMP